MRRTDNIFMIIHDWDELFITLITQFDTVTQLLFKTMIADAVTTYCDENSAECEGISIKQK